MSSRERALPHPYPLLTATAGALLIVGLLAILSASYVTALERYGSSFVFFNRQLLGAGLGVAAAAILARADYRRLRPLAGPLLLVVLGLLVLALIPGVGITRGGSSRWLPVGPLTFQPSELAKLSLVLFAAHVLERKGSDITEAKSLLIPVVPMAGLVVLLVVAQPDLGTAIICATAVLLIMFLAGARARHLAAILGVGGVLMVGLILTEAYRRARLINFFDPWADPTGSGWQSIQGQIALGSGGWFGLGLGASRQKWSFVPNAHTDFIYAILGEELGFAGAVAVLALFVFLIYLGARVAMSARDRFGFLLAGGITGWLGVQTIINMAAVVGLIPITGVPLPLISFGGSSLVFTMAGVGILLSISRRARA
jgi:cell division protein FtsW